MIYPVPQKNNLTGIPVETSSLCVSGDFKATAESVFASYNLPCTGGYSVVINCVNNRKTTYIDEISRLTDEKYFIIVSENEAVIEASCEKGVFRAANTLAKLIVNGELKTGELEDYPLFKKRGYIEGFYGKTWEQTKRISVMKLMAANGMNAFFYAPKDDLYHREKWRELYPREDLLELKALFETAKENFLDFHWAVGPGLTYKYTSDSDFEKLITKFMSLYDIGIRNFGLLLDDIPWEFQYEEDAAAFSEVVDAHICLINKTYSALKKIDPEITLTVCPTQYSGDENGYYISKFGSGIPSDVDVFWTGAEICSRVLTVREADELMRSTNHRPL
ncbi:MAG: beta-N-acetylglucosaminidase domain-containing protein, partial [Clostridia bacterium]|nr:beta-N-acetylglucosaminidase domain-containing protein [Clostridia bacterium]